MLIDIFRYALSLNIPLRSCITSGHGKISKTNRVLGPIANEACWYYERTNWIGVIVTNHPTLVLNNEAEINPNPELYEPSRLKTSHIALLVAKMALLVQHCSYVVCVFILTGNATKRELPEAAFDKVSNISCECSYYHLRQGS